MHDTDRVLVTRHSAYNTIVVTEDAYGLLTLRFGRDGVPQSVVKPGFPEHLELSYAHAMPLCLAFNPSPARVLIVGLGAGSLPSFFHLILPDSVIDVVEIDEQVLAVAKSHLGFCEDSRLKVHIADGRDFIENCPQQYDLIVLDSFDADFIPPHLVTLEFLSAVRHALTPSGIVAANVWGRDNNLQYDDMLKTHQAAFADLYVIDVPGPGTKIFIALQTPAAIDRNALIARTHQVQTQRNLAFKLADSIAGFRHASEEPLRGGCVLHD